MNNNEVFVPIGCDCSVAWYLRNNGYRQYAFPFDWTVVPIQSAIQLINNRFKDFLNIDNLIFLEPTNRFLFKENGIDVEMTEDIITPVYDSKYNIMYVHDFSQKGKQEYGLVREKYNKRVNKLMGLLNEKNTKIYFIYNNICINEWQELQYTKIDREFIKLKTHEISKLDIKASNAVLLSLHEFKRRKKENIL